MITNIRSPMEAFAAVAWLICSADKSGSPEELKFLYEQVKHLDIFETCTMVEFQHLFGTSFNLLFENPQNGELAIPQPDVEGLLEAVKEALTPELRADAFNMAVGLANSDSLCEVEATMLERLRDGLEIEEPH